MSTLPYINLGCGDKYHKDWVNIDLYSDSPFVKSCDLRKGIPFAENSFEVVYHSQVIEHYEKDDARRFMKECYRVLKPDGIIRIVTPDLENVVRNYLFYLEANINNPTEDTIANYEWMMLELYDQAVRNDWGGEMAKFLQRSGVINEQFVIDRIGYNARLIREKYRQKLEKSRRDSIRGRGEEFLAFMKEVIKKRKRIPGILRNIIFRSLLPKKEREFMQIGRFRKSGEIHYWLYDRYSLGALLCESGFRDTKIMNPHLSDIPDWDRYQLDVKNGEVFDPTSLFMEARK